MTKKIYVALLILVLSALQAFGWTEPYLLNFSWESDEVTLNQEDSAATSSFASEQENADIENLRTVHIEKKPWQPPDYSNQYNALGWSENVFAIPEGLKTRVQFWIDIYTRYTTHEGVLHDSLHVGVIYEKIDFNEIMKDASLTDKQKRKARKKFVESKKNEIKERLARLANLHSPDGLTGEDLRYWQMFSHVEEPQKFLNSMNHKRLRFQLGQSDRFLEGIYHSGKYLPEMEQIFRDNGLPIELTRLPFVESSFNVNARSRVGASGIWQFMRYTGRRFMQINYAVDERNDPIRATEAAARLFKINYRMLVKWPLAITGYNHGPAGVQRVVRKFKTDDIVELVDERNGRFGFASANFYAGFLAAVHVEKNAKHYFGEKLEWGAPVNHTEVRLSTQIRSKTLLNWFNGDIQKAKQANLHLTQSFWSGHATLSKKDFVRIPQEKYNQVLSELDMLRHSKVRKISSSELSEKAQQVYFINPGETLSDISLQFGVSIRLIMDINEIENPRRLRPGQKLVIPVKN